MARVSMGPRFEGLPTKESEEMKALKEQKRLEAEERRIERALFQKCDHIFEDVTEERRALIEGRDLPSWVVHLIAKEDPRWVNKRKLALEYGKCTGCGLLKVSDVEGILIDA